MVETNINLFDAIVIGVIAVSALLSLFRGLLREFLSLGTWIGAGLITLYLFPDVAEFMKRHIQSSVAASGLASIGTFILAFIVLALITRLLVKYLKTGAEVGAIDNILGLIFGILRGVLLMAMAYLAIGIMVPKDNPPEWLASSLTAPYIEKASNWLAAIAPDYLGDLMKLKEKPGAAGENSETPEILPLRDEESSGWPGEEVLGGEGEDEAGDEAPETSAPAPESRWPDMNDLQGAMESEGSE
jgi:membrane protein required for colicin V production